ncbi:MAG: cystathionine gamma-synthase family protein [Gammaproteobacteria bacterium]|jgi:O-acetylhomoserine (thiol)-lyase|nr:cystathionine gamma-synthase family protein [Gammaproteobacteria bacterium]MBU0828764.1 cystathionine gamma-synthase family protein [Gammaproteobacteria bacterium]MBU1817563.1 cystathionine gamma-synthase family protein [Gammaproteobacteria bacterium]
MTTPQNHSFTTQIVHADRLGGAEHGAIHKPIHTSVQYGYDKVEDLIAVFQGMAKGGFNYARQGTPTTAALEAKITQMERGLGTIAFSTGMAGICAVFLTLLKAGDHLVASQFVFGNTNSVLGTLADLGIEVTTVDVTNAANVAAALRPNTRMVFVETIANPGTQIPDLEGIGALCKAHGALYVVDNTVASPYLFRAATVGAGLVVNSLTKSIGGHGDALGGAITDTGLFDWSNYPNIFAAYRKGDPKGWGLQQLRKKGLRDMGGTLSSHAAHQLALGAETLSLRLDRTSATALALAQWLEAHPAVSRVLYPMLPSHPQHDQARKHLKAGSWLLSFELRDPDQCLPVCNRLQLPIKATGLADTRTLIIPVAHTIFWEAGAEVRASMGIADSMIRLSVGLEEVEDLQADFAQALAGA